MTPLEADMLAKRIINTWRGGPPLTEWVGVLTTLDYGTAGTCFVRLRDDLEHAPSIAKWMHTYKSLRTPANDPTDLRACHRNGCTDGAITYFTSHRGHRYRHTARCTCTAGRHNYPALPELPANLPPSAFDPDAPADPPTPNDPQNIPTDLFHQETA